ncbi:MAG: hypothetical protein KKB57_06785 [Proteobacteria bacterium]|nr:hypothetical protein [Pseudomonadota bacterium]MBU2469277.1 hypothetical protein [Pseudomonadota bacterium]MBU2517268.1 hypothetical protein [Pseudomonadota bacterium]
MLPFITRQWPAFVDAYLLWAEIYNKAGDKQAAIKVLQVGLVQKSLSLADRRRLAAMMDKLKKQVD